MGFIFSISGYPATKCLRFLSLEGFSAEIAVKGLAKMKDLRFINIGLLNYNRAEIVEFDKVSEYLPSSLRFMRWFGFPFSSLPNTFQGKHLVELEISDSKIVQLWEDGEGKVLHKLRFLTISRSKLRTCDLRLAPNLERLTIYECYDFVELKMPAETPNLEEINLSDSKLRTLDLGLTPNLKRLFLENCYDLVEINPPVGYLNKLALLDLSCRRFKSFVFEKYKWFQPAEAGFLSELHLIAEPTDVCPMHSDNDSPKFRFQCYYIEDPASSFGNLERLISLGLCPCTNLESFSRSICSLQCIRKLKLEGSITEAPRDLDQLECLEELTFSSTEIKYLPDSICKFKHLKSFKIKSCWLLEKLPEDIGRLESLEKLILTECKLLQYIPNSICKMKCINSFDLRGCIRVVELPEDIGCLEGLKELNIEGTGITRLPQSIFQLRDLNIVESRWRLATFGLSLKRRRTSDDDEIVATYNPY